MNGVCDRDIIIDALLTVVLNPHSSDLPAISYCIGLDGRFGVRASRTLAYVASKAVQPFPFCLMGCASLAIYRLC